MDEDIDDEQVWDIAREKAMMAPERIRLVTQYILNNFDKKTYRGDKSYIYNTLTNISEVASSKKAAVEEIKQKQRVSGFNSIFAVSSVPMAKLYYQEFKKQMASDPTKNFVSQPSTVMVQMSPNMTKLQVVSLMRKTQKIHQHLTSHREIFLIWQSKIITRCSILIIRQILTSSKIIIKMYLFV